MYYIFFEIFVIISWIFVIFTRIRKDSSSSFEEIFILFFTIPISFSFELINEYYFHDVGLYYLHSLAIFKPFNFPVAVVFYISLFSWFIYFISLRLSKFIVNKKSFAIFCQLCIIVILIPISILIEYISYKMGYIDYYSKVFPIHLNTFLRICLLYSFFVLIPFVFSKFFSYYFLSKKLIVN